MRSMGYRGALRGQQLSSRGHHLCSLLEIELATPWLKGQGKQDRDRSEKSMSKVTWYLSSMKAQTDGYGDNNDADLNIIMRSQNKVE